MAQVEIRLGELNKLNSANDRVANELRYYSSESVEMAQRTPVFVRYWS